MNLSSPIASVIPSAHGAVLDVLARTDQPLSGRAVALLTHGRFGQWRVNEVLAELAKSGIVLREDRPPAKLHRLNRQHVAATAIIALVMQRNELFKRIRDHAAGWTVTPRAVWVFGSVARGDGGIDSDIDLLVLRRDSVDPDEPDWLAQVNELSGLVAVWSGNSCEVVELAETELVVMVRRDDRLVRELRSDAVTLHGESVADLLRQRAAR